MVWAAAAHPGDGTVIRLGIVDFDTSHVVEFTKRLNHVDIAEDQWVEGAKVVAGVPGRSLFNPEIVPKYTDQMKKMGVPLFDDPADLIGKIDAVLIEANDGNVHRDHALPFLEKGIPTFVDKPFACTLADARAMVDIAQRKHVPLMSCSSLRYAPEAIEAKLGKGPAGAVAGVLAYGPASLHARNPGLFNYGIHVVELVYAIMGPGCQQVTCASRSGADVATGVWSDGRLATVRGNRGGRYEFGFTVFGTKAAIAQGATFTDTYRDMLKEVVRMFETQQLPVDLRETLEIIAFIEAANRSAGSGGGAVDVKV
jgi:virulence factor